LALGVDPNLDDFKPTELGDLRGTDLTVSSLAERAITFPAASTLQLSLLTIEVSSPHGTSLDAKV
jgi:hypothetical protein